MKKAIGERILLSLWVGSLWTSGYIVAPLLFKQLDRMTAGHIAGQLFTIVSYIGLFVLVLSLLLAIAQGGMHALQQWRQRSLLVMLLILVIGQFVLHPMMTELKAAGLQGENARQFATLHGVSSILFLVNSILGLALLAWSSPAREQMQG